VRNVDSSRSSASRAAASSTAQSAPRTEARRFHTRFAAVSKLASLAASACSIASARLPAVCIGHTSDNAATQGETPAAALSACSGVSDKTGFGRCRATSTPARPASTCARASMTCGLKLSVAARVSVADSSSAGCAPSPPSACQVARTAGTFHERSARGAGENASIAAGGACAHAVIIAAQTSTPVRATIKARPPGFGSL
jgi:hypothetical protein